MRTPLQEKWGELETVRLWTQVKEGMAWLWGHAFLRTCALLFVGGNFLFGALELVLIVAAKRQGLSSAVIGGLVAATGAFSLLGPIAAPPFFLPSPIRRAVLLPPVPAP